MALGASTTTKTTTEPNTPNSAPAKMRFPFYYRYIPHEDVAAYEAKGWEASTALLNTHHGEHATLMCWEREGPPNE
jgi:hypothetical protein